MAGALAVLGGYFLWRGRDSATYLLGTGGFFLLAALLTPRLLTPVERAWMAFAELLGDTVPSEAYLAPIECAGQIVAMLYADNLPDDEPIGDTSAIEGVLQHAGESLDRAAFERALAEVGSDVDIDS